MTFQALKEHAGLAAVTVIIAWSGHQLSKLNDTAAKLAEEMVGMKRDTANNTYRLDQHRDSLKDLRDQLGDQRVRTGNLEIKVFGHNVKL